MISLRKAENFIFSFITFFMASPLRFSSSFASLFPCHSWSLGLERASIDLALRKLPLFPEPLVIFRVFFRVPLCEDVSLCISCLAGSLFKKPLLSIRGAVSSPSSKYLCSLEMSVHDCECWGFFGGNLSVGSLVVSEDRLEDDVEEEEEKEEEEEEEEEVDVEEEDEEEPVEELRGVSERETWRWFSLRW